MPIFKLNGSELVVAQETELELEQHLEDWIENSPTALVQGEPILWIGRQTNATVENVAIFPDLLGVDSEGNLVIVELKRDQAPRDVVAQLLEYAAWANELTKEQIHEVAEEYFATHDITKEMKFHEAFNELFEIDEVPALNRNLRLFIVGRQIPVRVSRVCRFLRTSHGMDITCIAISTFQTESGEVLVSTETKVGDEDILAPKSQKIQRWSGEKPVRQVVQQAIDKLTAGDPTAEFTPKEVITYIRREYPEFKEGTVHGELAAGCPNHKSHHHHSVNNKFYWKVSLGKYRLYRDPGD